MQKINNMCDCTYLRNTSADECRSFSHRPVTDRRDSSSGKVSPELRSAAADCCLNRHTGTGPSAAASGAAARNSCRMDDGRSRYRRVNAGHTGRSAVSAVRTADCDRSAAQFLSCCRCAAEGPAGQSDCGSSLQPHRCSVGAGTVVALPSRRGRAVDAGTHFLTRVSATATGCGTWQHHRSAGALWQFASAGHMGRCAFSGRWYPGDQPGLCSQIKAAPAARQRVLSRINNDAGYL